MCLDLGFDFQLDLVREIMAFPFDGLLIRLLQQASMSTHILTSCVLLLLAFAFTNIDRDIDFRLEIRRVSIHR